MGAHWESTNVEHPGLTMGKVRQISADLDDFRCTNNDSYSKIDRFKNSYNANPIGERIQSCRDYRRFCSPRYLAVFAQLCPWQLLIGNSHGKIEHTRLLD